MLLRRTSAAGTSPVTLTEAKAQLRVDDTSEDTLIAALIASSTALVGEMAGRVMAEETWAASWSSIAGDIVLPKSPVKELVSVTYYDSADTLQTMSNSDFYLFRSDDLTSLRPKPNKSWPVTAAREDAITITFTAGYTTLPTELRMAVLLCIGHLFEHRSAVDEAMSELPMGVDALVSTQRLGWMAA